MKILHLISQRPDATGSGIYLRAMLREAVARGHRNHLVAGWPAGEDLPDGLRAETIDWLRFGRDLPHPIVGMSDVMPYPSTRFRDLSPAEVETYRAAWRRLVRRAAADFRPDVIHSHHLWLLTALARDELSGVPMVANCHGSDLRQMRICPELGDQVRESCRRLDAVLTLSRNQETDLDELYGLESGRIHRVGAGYNESLFVPGTRPSPDPVRIVYAGKLSRSKGVPWLLRALAGIESPAWRLHLVGGGSGDERRECLELAAVLGDRVRVHGALPQTELAALLGRSHVFVLPSLFEGLPLVLLEALACGCRLVATRLPGVDEVLGDLGADLVGLVPLPALDGIDTPAAGAEADFTRHIATALTEQLERAARCEPPDEAAVAERLATFRWSEVFARVENAYRAAGAAIERKDA